ncbi:MAG: hypothetical protein IJU05_02040 [Schwartzia sp.]|nr:hypothetical protein [Schwartzia sp. (in: firmicutes)]
MNSKAESFKAYLEEKKIDAFAVEEIEGDDQNTVAFRAHITVEGQQLPTVVIVDDSVFSIIRVQISPRARSEENEKALRDLVEQENAKYKPFKLYCAADGSLILDACVISEGDKLNGDIVYLLFSVIINYLNEYYRSIMKVIW